MPCPMTPAPRTAIFLTSLASKGVSAPPDRPALLGVGDYSTAPEARRRRTCDSEYPSPLRIRSVSFPSSGALVKGLPLDAGLVEIGEFSTVSPDARVSIEAPFAQSLVRASSTESTGVAQVSFSIRWDAQ